MRGVCEACLLIFAYGVALSVALPTNSTPLSKLWHWTADVSLTSPIVEGDMVLLGGGNGNAYALDRFTGHPIWAFTTSDSIVAKLGSSNSTVFVASTDKNIYAVDRTTGRQIWNNTFGNRYREGESPVYAPESHAVIVANHDSYMAILDASNGTSTLAVTADYAPFVTEAAFYAGSTNGYLSKFSFSGNSVCSLSMPDSSRVFSPIALKPVVIAGSHDGYVYAMDHNTCDQKWQLHVGPMLLSAPTVAYDKAGNPIVVVASSAQSTTAGRVTAIYPFLGTAAWQYNHTSAPIAATPAYDARSHRIFVGDSSGGILVLDARTGAKIEVHYTGHRFPSGTSFAVSADSCALYVATHTSAFAFSLGCATVAPATPAPAPVTQSPPPSPIVVTRCLTGNCTGTCEQAHETVGACVKIGAAASARHRCVATASGAATMEVTDYIGATDCPESGAKESSSYAVGKCYQDAAGGSFMVDRCPV